MNKQVEVRCKIQKTAMSHIDKGFIEERGFMSCNEIWQRRQKNGTLDLVFSSLQEAYYRGFQEGLEVARRIYNG